MWLNKLFRCQTSFHFNPDSFHQFQQIWREKNAEPRTRLLLAGDARHGPREERARIS